MTENHMHEVMDRLSPSVFAGLLTVDGVLTYANKAALDAIGAQAEEVLGRPFDATPWWRFSDQSRQRLRESIRAAGRGLASRFDVPILDLNGRVRTMDFTLHPVYDDNGNVTYLVPSGRDITERRQAERELRLTQFAVDHARGAMFQIDADGRVRYANRAACDMLGYAREDLTGRLLSDIDPTMTEGVWREHLHELKAQGSARLESLARRSDGGLIPIEVTATYIEYEGEPVSFSYVDDLTARRASEERIHYLTRFDGLTRLPNRTALHERLEQAIESAQHSNSSVALLIVGLDRLGLVNDALGHAGGDEVLRAIAERLSACAETPATVARIGGDEFAIMYTTDTQQDLHAEYWIQRILESVSEPLRIDDQEICLTCSIGSAAYPTDGTDSGELFKNASSALRCAKGRGRNMHQAYAIATANRDPERLFLESALRGAQKYGEFSVHYQPRIDVDTGAPVGAEALLRWHHPDKGMISPARFIPIAEETGLIESIGEWVLRAACEQNRLWRESDLKPGRIGVNLSARQFRHADLALRVVQLLKESGLDPEHLELEITESMLMEDVDAAITTMTCLKDYGVSIALDDFGTGYSCLSYLKRFPIDTLKIDQSFVREITSDPASAAIADAIIAMAQRLGLDVIAEGVETPEQCRLLRESGCRLMQGYLFARPVPAEDLTKLLRVGNLGKHL
ncbi:EAL domain-containing protein [Marinobacter adhaerens]|jgi:diguanylate cyclase (GGDEF)-like protein/PAS domain S-box-containing protein|uniref:EAL domain-containing protein n=2 Tax=Marinobacter adhaerens TaxID=1033846 RepID=A0ABX8IEA5_9GAMM|nr:bifunctional diguanylate cyclase/phosphodiesterase [Marinobacter adhaerens]ADP97453.1 sensory box/GGDEF family protein [Marinobacter adhaerens HP15]MBW4978595.1 EAL domain-containing protein [Marinobacter adhaerens]QWV11534.1 EAL domain-containing protein [Marinobacter adhaerens]